MSKRVSTAFVIALLEAGVSMEGVMAAMERLPDAEGHVVQAIREMLAAGIPTEKCLQVGKQIEDDGYPTRRALYERAPRTKKYGPAGDLAIYDSPEKRRAYGLSREWIDRPPVERLAGDDWWPLVGEVFRRDDFTCTYCGADGENYLLHCDHIVPISRGGVNLIFNLTTACDYCNCSKRDRLPHEWRPWSAPA